jgi:hypothetical protein
MAGWGTPRVSDGTLAETTTMPPSGTRSRLELEVLLTGCPTPNCDDANNATRDSGQFQSLTRTARLAGWPTPAAHEAGGTPEQFLERKRRAIEQGSQLGISLTSLSLMAQTVVGSISSPMTLGSWPTPTARDFKSALRTESEQTTSPPLSHVALLAGWTTPQAHDVSGRSEGQKQIHGTKHGCACLVRDAQLAGWPTPMAGSPATENYNEAGNTDSSRKTVSLVGWPTPRTRDDLPETLEAWETRNAQKKAENPNLGSIHRPLNIAAQEVAGWPTPSAEGSAGEVSEDLERVGNKWRNKKTGRILQTNLATDVKMLVQGWNTPRATDGSNRGPNQSGGALSHDAQLAGWATPDAPRSKDSDASAFRWNPNKKQDDAVTQILGRDTPLSAVPMEKRGALNAAHSRWLQGYPRVWDVAAILAHRLIHSRPRKRASCASGGTATPSTPSPVPSSSSPAGI